jgi:hypothetical protein
MRREGKMEKRNSDALALVLSEEQEKEETGDPIKDAAPWMVDLLMNGDPITLLSMASISGPYAAFANSDWIWEGLFRQHFPIDYLFSRRRVPIVFRCQGQIISPWKRFYIHLQRMYVNLAKTMCDWPILNIAEPGRQIMLPHNTFRDIYSFCLRFINGEGTSYVDLPAFCCDEFIQTLTYGQTEETFGGEYEWLQDYVIRSKVQSYKYHKRILELGPAPAKQRAYFVDAAERLSLAKYIREHTNVASAFCVNQLLKLWDFYGRIIAYPCMLAYARFKVDNHLTLSYCAGMPEGDDQILATLLRNDADHHEDWCIIEPRMCIIPTIWRKDEFRQDCAVFSDLPRTMQGKVKVIKSCIACGETQSQYVCGHCKIASYCSVGCQQQDWHRGGHGETCRAITTIKKV